MQLRSSLQIAPDTECIFERYSDSAASFVTLDRTNAIVYKQLYKAAKAKQRLKIKVTTQKKDGPQKSERADESQPPAQIPKPVTVENEPEPEPEPEPLPSPPLTATPSEVNQASNIVMDDVIPPVPPKPVKVTPKVEAHPGPAATAPVGVFNNITKPELIQLANRSILCGGPKPPANPGLHANIGRVGFTVCCNKCDAVIPDMHYHCQTCDNGDFDLCPSCIDAGVTCDGPGHSLIKRFVFDGQIVTNTKEMCTKHELKSNCNCKSKPAAQFEEPKKNETAPAPAPTPILAPFAPVPGPAPRTTGNNSSAGRIIPRYTSIRTCNSCVQEFPESRLVHCTTCHDFDLCKECFVRDKHGHHPGHAFEPVVYGDKVERIVKARLAPGRNARHGALCDGCDEPILGVRHKCLDCPDWDYCSDCVVDADFVHAGHRFVPIYKGIQPGSSNVLHMGIRCDGPLCSTNRGKSCIKGIRYKCTVCHDTDFCGNCEASPANTHNKTHPLIKFKTPVRHVTVTTTGDKRLGEPLPMMGDRTHTTTSIRSTSTTSAIPNSEPNIISTKPCNAATPIKTIVDVKPLEVKTSSQDRPRNVLPKLSVDDCTPPRSFSSAGAAVNPVEIPKTQYLQAVYVCDAVADGTVMAPNHVFEQTWTLRNEGKVAWPANCSVKFVGGDYMGHIDPTHPTGVRDLIAANESTVCYQPLEPGYEFTFNVLLRTPVREGKAISYWRLTDPDGNKFGHRLWCDVMVKKQAVERTPNLLEPSPSEAESQKMIFPKLEKESPVSSIHQDSKSEPPAGTSQENSEEAEEVEEVEDDEDWVAESDSILTDDEYDLINASDEEYCNMMEKSCK